MFEAGSCDGLFYMQVAECDQCSGTGQQSTPCNTCGGDGRVRKSKKVIRALALKPAGLGYTAVCEILSGTLSLERNMGLSKLSACF